MRTIWNLIMFLLTNQSRSLFFTNHLFVFLGISLTVVSKANNPIVPVPFRLSVETAFDKKVYFLYSENYYNDTHSTDLV